MTEESVNQRKLIEARVERWIAEAKKLVEAGNEASGLELYKKAADELPGAPWLQHRTAELSRKRKQPEAAVHYFRRAATAFQLADFPKRAIAPLRTAWTIAVEHLPSTSKALVDLSHELMQLQRRLGFAADASVTLERTNAALRSRGFSELAPQESDNHTTPPASSVAPRSVVASGDAPSSSRARALARKLGHR